MANSISNQFSGLHKDIWFLSITTFINKFGSMLIPFLTIYLKSELKFSYFEIDCVMFCLGAGSICGNYFSIKVSDLIGHYKTMVLSLTLTGIMFLVLYKVTDFYTVCALIFFLTCISDLFRPAMLTFIKTNTNSTNSAKALSLYRTADNLGFLFGPTIAGLVLIYSKNNLLCLIDGATCLLAALFFIYKIKEKKMPFKLKVNKELNPKSIFNDRAFILHLIVTLITGVLFFQIFITLPFYDEEILKIPYYSNGFFISAYALILLVFEFPIVSMIEKRKINKIRIISCGLLLMILGFACLLAQNKMGLFFMLIFISFGVIFTYPFSISFAMARSNKYQVANYMAIITVSYSVARVLSSTIGMNIISEYGFQANWIVMIVLGFIGFLLSIRLNAVIARDENMKKEDIFKSVFIDSAKK
jgi:predicted MFS family arabinose efflux permease